MGLFDYFPAEPITLIACINSAKGNTEGSQYDSWGVFKLRGNLQNQTPNIDALNADATLMICGDDEFVEAVEGVLEGNLVRIARGNLEERLYRITGSTEGYDYDNHCMDFYKLSLKRERETWHSSSPLV